MTKVYESRAAILKWIVLVVLGLAPLAPAEEKVKDDHGGNSAPVVAPPPRAKSDAKPAKSGFSGKPIPPPEKPPFTVGPNEDLYYNLYRRPNDDTFQNGGGPGNAGTPFQVGWMWCSIVAEKNQDGSLKQLKFRWDYSDLTGRHAEAPESFILRESRNDLAGETEAVKYGERNPENKAAVKIRYPNGVNAESPTQKKIGTTSSAMVSVINPNQLPLKDGTYSGNLQIRLNPELFKSRGGLAQLEGNAGPKEGIFKNNHWKITIKDGKIVDQDVGCMRFNPDQPLQLVKSNYLKELPKLKHPEYVEQTPAAECKKDTETVGTGGDDFEDKVKDKTEVLTKKMGGLIEKAGCLSCHGQGTVIPLRDKDGKVTGTKDNSRYCDDGRPVRPDEDAFSLYSMMVNGVPKRGHSPYPSGMYRAITEIREEIMKDKTASGLRKDLRDWASAFGHKVQDSADNELKLMAAAQEADMKEIEARKMKK